MAIKHKKRKRFPKYKETNKLMEISIFIMLLFLLIGVVLGSVSAVRMDEIEYIRSVESINKGLILNSSKTQIFTESILKNMKIILPAWIFGFFPGSAIALLFIIGFRGFGVGYTASIFLMEFGNTGIFLSAAMFFAQNITLVLICVFIGRNYHRNIDMTERFVTILVSMFAVFIIGLYEAYVCPLIYSLLL